MSNFLDREPALTGGLIQAIVVVVFAFLKLSPAQMAAIEGAVITCVAWVTRAQVTPVFSPNLPHLGITPDNAAQAVRNILAGLGNTVTVPAVTAPALTPAPVAPVSPPAPESAPVAVAGPAAPQEDIPSA